MTRAEIYYLIDEERNKQDEKWSDRSQYSRSAPHLLLLQQKTAKMGGLWYEAKRDALIAEFVKVAAIAIRALEEIDPTT